MNYFLDTNICSYFLKGTYPQLAEHLKQVAPSQIKIASVVKAELLYGAYRSEQILDKIRQFILPFEVVGFDDLCTNIYAEIRARLEKQGTPIGPNDLIIAATALANESTLITNNEKEFSRIEELRFENWTK